MTKIKQKKYGTLNPIPQREIQKFTDRIRKLAEKKFGTDEGRILVQVKVVNLTTHMPNSYLPFPHWDPSKNGMDNIKERIGIISANLSLIDDCQQKLYADILDGCCPPSTSQVPIKRPTSTNKYT